MFGWIGVGIFTYLVTFDRIGGGTSDQNIQLVSKNTKSVERNGCILSYVVTIGQIGVGIYMEGNPHD
jgi:hypothetical protein